MDTCSNPCSAPGEELNYTSIGPFTTEGNGPCCSARLERASLPWELGLHTGPRPPALAHRHFPIHGANFELVCPRESELGLRFL